MDTNEAHEGHAIKALLDENGLTVQDLARQGGVVWQAAKKWIQTEKFKAGARESAADALQRVGIDPRRIWPSYTPPQIKSAFDDLKKLLEGFESAQLDSLKQLLAAERSDQIRLIDFIEGIAFARKL